ncbi:hypothetical protein ASPBRDRAFT_674777 [Aspergillus brasiliensis CBS 101740]|uniref:Uncharacterized protein n=1 Tax=Aspergillus brasiliensis (strain CBS 101740 / IMI 381727 / IBT 21946) TaxID=767769 RepID=A0A1L9UJT6_ASPBC|nr:hypothetical protein ASPBRDRAFT_674777 [Aspergillus brasiliensis CBS 101740]
MMIWSKPRLGVGRWSRCVGPSSMPIHSRPGNRQPSAITKVRIRVRFRELSLDLKGMEKRVRIQYRTLFDT